MNNLCIVTYTHSNCKDLWLPYFESLEHYAAGIKSYVFCNELCDKYVNHNFLKYNDDNSYCREFAQLLRNIKEEYFIYMQEDFILYNFVNKLKLVEYQNLISNSELSYVRLIKCGDVTEINYINELYYVSKNGHSNHSINSFAMQPTIWKKSDFIELYEMTDRNRFGEHYEYSISMNQLNMNGLYAYCGETKRGANHYDSSIFPYIATAIVKGKWNISEYGNELDNIFKKYNIDKNIRGLF